MTLNQMRQRAQADANRSGKAIALLNLNRIGAPLYVCREYTEQLSSHPQLLDVFEPVELKHFSSSSGHITLSMTLDDAQRASHQGQCDDDVLALSRMPHIACQLAVIDADTLRRELREYGAWDASELADHEQNLQRILWLAAGDIVDGNCD